MFGIFGPTSESLMAKKKAGRPKSPDGPKDERIVMRASKSWRAWLERIKRERRWETSYFVRQAFKAWAEKENEEQPPEE